LWRKTKKGGGGGTYRRQETYILWGDLRERDNLEDLGVDGRIRLNVP